MSKGSSYWGTARGKIGNTVVSVVRGQRIERAWQPSVRNPRTPPQMIQRAKFFSAVEFYKNSRQGLFKMAFEDKRQTESDYNAFMRHNTMGAPMLSREVVEYGDGTRAQAAWTWQVSNGSLEPVTVAAVANTPGKYSLGFISKPGDLKNVAELSASLINSGAYQAGDIVTIVEQVTDIETASPDDGVGLLPAFVGKGGVANQFTIKQFELNQTDDTPLEDYNISYNETEKKLNLESFSDAKDVIRTAAIIISRPGVTLKVSTASMAGDSYTNTQFDAMKTENWQQGVLQQWKTAEAAILEGSLV